MRINTKFNSRVLWGKLWTYIFYNALALFVCMPVLAQTPSNQLDAIKAAKFDDIRGIQALLNQGLISPNMRDGKGTPLLLLALEDRSMKVLYLLMDEQQVDIDAANRNGENTLMMASLYGLMPEVKYLVEKKAAIFNREGWTPLHYAASTGQTEIAAYLLEQGAAVNALSESNTTPLMMAVRSGNIETVSTLLKNGADMQIVNHQGFTAIDVADLFERTDISKGLSSRWFKLYKQKYTHMMALPWAM
ncbi:MAG: ankyrin repeat domain-containing protein [Burkholderiales bacterium]|nr:ankyrin repeat domain-containing protein [Burkholderiales bacterium]